MRRVQPGCSSTTVVGLDSPRLDTQRSLGLKIARFQFRTVRRLSAEGLGIRALAVALALSAVLLNRTADCEPRNGIHPAVVRVVATDRDGFSLGSGTLVAVSEHHGLVVTNWHVVRDAAGPIAVVFPNGFRSQALVLKTDPVWDLAALAIWRPNVEPVPLSNTAPRPGEPLTIAGYGSGQYRTITGRCTQYVAPGLNKPFEMVELSAPARQGDSGGPIFNSRGELAGVLFGTARGQTSGSYCGRVRAFLESVRDDFYRLAPHPAALARQASSPAQAPTRGSALESQNADSGALPSAATWPNTPLSSPSVAIAVNASAPPSDAGTDRLVPVPSPLPPAESPPAPRVDLADLPSPQHDSLWNDLRNYLAVVGVAAILFHLAKFLTEAKHAGRRRRYY